MSEQDPEDPAARGPKRPRRGHFDPKEEIPFADDEAPFPVRGDGVAPSGDPDDAEPDDADNWDADDPRRQADQMAPPAEPCECYCLHCGRTFMSDKIWFQKVIGSKDGFDGFWMCPTPNCGGAGFTFDIFPTDPTHPANAGWTYSDDDEEEEAEGTWDDETGDFLAGGGGGAEEPDKDYDPDETKYKELDDLWGDGDDDDDLEGEEWKYGLQPGERPEMPMSEEARREREAEERKYDLPDERPRELDWTNREEDQGPSGKPSGDWRDDDIPF